MQVLAFTEAPDHVCYRYRLQAFAPALARRGYRLTEVPLARGTLERIGQLRLAREADIVILQRRRLQFWQLALLRRWSKVLIYDFDDALFLRDSFARKSQTSWSRERAFRAAVRAADLTLAGNAWLAERARRYSDRVQVMPTCIDADRYVAAQHHRIGGDTRLAWIGQRSTLPYLALARPCLSEIGRRVPGIQIDVISDTYPDDLGVPVVPHRWSIETEVHDLANADIGIAWLTDDDWSRGKCGLRVLQYMAAGLPVVANPAALNRDMIIDGENGFLASTPEEWSQRVAQLAANPELRRRMGASARQYVLENYSVAGWASRFVDRITTQSDAPSSAPVPPERRRSRAPRAATSDAALRTVVLLLTMLAGALWGCARLHDLPPTLPAEPVVVRDQLVLSSTFPLPYNHRLVEELVAQRYDLAAKLDLPTSDEPIHVFLFDNAEKFQAFLNERFPHFPKRRAFFVETDTRLSVYAHWGDRVGEDLRHEVAHGYLHSVVPKLPLWVDEGLAEYFEVPRGNAGFNPPHVIELKQRLENGWQPDLVRLESLKGAGDMTQADYAESWAWVHLCLEGNQQAGDVLRHYLQTLRREGKAEPLSSQLHRQFPDIRNMWLAHFNHLAQLPLEG